jgi:hypothetical protein
VVEKLFIDNINPGDGLYRVIRDENRPSTVELKSYTENLWVTYHPYADKDFPEQLAQDFHARFWEMYLTCTLVYNSVNVVPKRTRAEGPDIKIDHASTTIWVEAVAPTSGDLSRPDSVFDPRMGVAQQVPDDQIILRYRSAIHDKYFGKYFGYLEKGVIESGDCYIIALNGCKIPWPGSDYEPPRIVRSVLPFGWQVVTVDTSSHKVVDRSYQYRAYLRKASGGTVDTDIFVKSEYSNISAVIFSNVDVANRTLAMGDDFIIVRNPLALRKLPDDFPKVGREYKAELSKNTINLFSKKLR